MEKQPKPVTKKDTLIGVISFIFLILVGLSQCQIDRERNTKQKINRENAKKDLIIEKQTECMNSPNGNIDKCLNHNF